MKRISFLLSLFLLMIQSNECFFKLITTLYNETKQERVKEYLECMERNLAHPAIEEIHVFYDTSKDAPQDNLILEYLQENNVRIKYISGRASFGQLFDYANQECPNQKVIVTNADIYFNETLFLLQDFDFTNRFLALTRWDRYQDGTLKLLRNSNGTPNTFSQDSWFFQTPLKKIECSFINMGILFCDSELAYRANESGLEVFNPCYSIQCIHVHLSGIRSSDRERKAHGLKFRPAPWIKLEDIH